MELIGVASLRLPLNARSKKTPRRWLNTSACVNMALPLADFTRMNLQSRPLRCKRECNQCPLMPACTNIDPNWPPCAIFAADLVMDASYRERANSKVLLEIYSVQYRETSRIGCDSGAGNMIARGWDGQMI